MRWAPWLRVLLLCVAGVAAATGCAGPSGGQSAAVPRPASAVEAFRALRYPPPDLVLAERAVIGRCMRAVGYAYPAEPRPAPEVGEALLLTSARFTVERARVDGYGSLLTRGVGGDAEQPVGPVDEYVRSLSRDDQNRFLAALNDRSSRDVVITLPGGLTASAESRGCTADARQEVYGSVANFLALAFLPNVPQALVTEVGQDPDLSRVNDLYVACLREAGYPVATPSGAAELAETYYRDSGPAAVAREREIALAVADATCQARSGLHEAYLGAVDRIAVNWITAHEQEVLHAAAVQQEALARAATVLR